MNHKGEDTDVRESCIRQPGAWIKELFTPVYDFDAIVEAERDGYKLEEKKIKRVPILDPETVREVFERVHQRITNAETKRLEEINTEKVARNSSLWNTEELETLRKVYKSTEGEISKLKIALREQMAHSKLLEEVVLRQRQELENVKQHLAEASKCNKRLVIHRDSLQKDLAMLDIKLAALTDMWHGSEAEKVQAMKKAQAAQMELDKERLYRQRLECGIAEAHRNLLKETELVARNVQTKYELEVSDLQDVIKDLTVELRQEKSLHEASKRGLQHLHDHFSSQHLVASSAVEKDEVEQIDHCSL